MNVVFIHENWPNQTIIWEEEGIKGENMQAKIREKGKEVKVQSKREKLNSEEKKFTKNFFLLKFCS